MQLAYRAQDECTIQTKTVCRAAVATCASSCKHNFRQTILVLKRSLASQPAQTDCSATAATACPVQQIVQLAAARRTGVPLAMLETSANAFSTAKISPAWRSALPLTVQRAPKTLLSVAPTLKKSQWQTYTRCS